LQKTAQFQVAVGALTGATLLANHEYGWLVKPL
jgi:hypothetical protein